MKVLRSPTKGRNCGTRSIEAIIVRTSNRKVHTPIPRNGTPVGTIVRRNWTVIDMACTGRFIRITVKVKVIGRTTAHDNSIANLEAVDRLWICLKALVAICNVDGDVVWRAIAERNLREACVASGHAADIAGALARVAGHCAGGCTVEAGCAIADIWSRHAIEVMG
jgi:hypothetical protein